MAPSFPKGNDSVELTQYFHQKDIVEMQLHGTLLLFSTIVVSAVLRQAGLGMSSEDIQIYFQQPVLLKEHGVWGVLYERKLNCACSSVKDITPEDAHCSLQLNIIVELFLFRFEFTFR